jgi:hypothetical protein
MDPGIERHTQQAAQSDNDKMSHGHVSSFSGEKQGEILPSSSADLNRDPIGSGSRFAQDLCKGTE